MCIRDRGQSGTNAGQGAQGAVGSQGATGAQGGLSTYSIPSGGIIIWSGASNAIPTGWVLCDGNNSTPDLRNRFIVGAGNSYNVGVTGGFDSVSLSESQIPGHTHGVSLSTNNPGDHDQM